MFCRNCQTIIPDDSLFCENCGAPTGLNPEQIDDGNLVPEEAVEFEVTKDEEPIQTTSVPVDPIWWEPPEEENEPIDVEIAPVFEEEDWAEAEDLQEEAEDLPKEPEIEASKWKSGLDAVQDWEPAPAGEPEDTDELEVPGFMKTAEPEAESKEETAKLYAAKAKSLLAGLGKHVHTGTGWAVGAAKEQFQQRKEGFTDRKEQREQQREQEKREKEREQERKERERQRELEQLQEEERRAQEKVIQQPGFWYGDNMPEPTIAFAHAVKAGSDSAEHAPKDLSEQTETAEHEDEHAPEMVEIPTLADISKETDLLRTPAFDTLREMEEEEEPQEPTGPSESTEPVQEPVQEPSQEPLSGLEPLQEPESLSEEEIEDKLAETTRYDWSKGEIEAAVAAADAANDEDTSDAIDSVDITDFAAIKDPSIVVDDEETAEEEEPVNLVYDPDQPASIVEEDVPPDEPAIYRIQDFGPVTGSKTLTMKEPNTPERKDVIKIVAVIAAVLLAMGIVAGVMLHQAHVRQMEEEAYQAGLVQAQELVDHHKYKKAEKAYLALIDERPEDPEPYLGLADMYIEQQRYVDAKALVKRAVEATGDEEAFAETKKELKILTSKKWKKAYVKVLEDHESDIRKYEEDVTASVAVCDVNGDRKPELFFFTKEYYGYGKLHIYTMVSGKAKEVDYECKNRGTQYHDAFYDVSANDSSYAIFNGSGKGEFQIYANVGSGGRPWDTTNEYKLNLKGGCKRLKVIEGSVDTTYGENDIDDSEYLMDDEPITYDKYIAEFRKVLDGVQQVILYNGSGGDQAVWDKVKPDNVMCMTYDAMMVDLKAK